MTRAQRLTRPQRTRGEHGAVAVEFAVLVPCLGLLLAVMIGAARVWFAHATVEQISGTAARAASLQTTAGEARAAAERIARQQAGTSGLNCVGLTIRVDVSGFRVPVGQPARVSVDVVCAVPLAELLVPGWPGTWQVRAEGGSALDRYRRRG